MNNEELLMKEYLYLLREETYKEFFQKKLNDYGVSSPAKLSNSDKKKFFSEIEKEWKGKKESD